MAGSVVVVGGGPGGYAAALGLARAGWQVRVVEAREVGGTCLQRGCIPTKALLESARLAADIARAAEFGITAGPGGVDWPAVQARQSRLVGLLTNGLRGLLQQAGVQVDQAWATLLPPLAGAHPRVRIVPLGTHGAANTAGPGGKSGPPPASLASPDCLILTPDAVVLAPGSVPVRPAIPGMELPGVVDSDGLLAIADRPASLCILGGGAIGCEFASAYTDLGTEVTLLEALPQLLPRAEPDLARRLQAALRRRGVTVRTDARVQRIAEGPVVRVASGEGPAEDLAADAVLVAVGRRPATDGLGLAEAGVGRRPDGAIVVDAGLRTGATGVWALGDALGGPMVAHRAIHQAATVVAAITGHPLPPVNTAIPQPVFCRPEVAWVGQTEAEAAAAGAGVAVARVPLAALGRAQAAGETDGLFKVVADGMGRVVGVHLIGSHATELIGAACVALSVGARAEDLLNTMFPHPTLVEGLGEAAGLLLGRPLHVPSGR